MFNAPCKDCPDRHELCHSDCDRYIAYQIVNGILREQKIKEKKLQDDIWATSRHSKKQKKRRPYADNRGEH